MFPSAGTRCLPAVPACSWKGCLCITVEVPSVRVSQDKPLLWRGSTPHCFSLLQERFQYSVHVAPVTKSLTSNADPWGLVGAGVQVSVLHGPLHCRWALIIQGMWAGSGNLAQAPAQAEALLLIGV